MIIDCDTCVARPAACGECVVTALLAGPSDGQWSADEIQAVSALSESGLVSPLRYVRGRNVV